MQAPEFPAPQATTWTTLHRGGSYSPLAAISAQESHRFKHSPLSAARCFISPSPSHLWRRSLAFATLVS